MPPDGNVVSVAGKKRSADDGFDPLTAPISLKPTPPYDPKTQEQAPHSVAQSKDWTTYIDCEQQIEQLLISPPTKFNYNDQYIEGLTALVHERISGRIPEQIKLAFVGPMGTGKSATLNSLFGVGQIAREGDLGGSCTLTTCVYSKAKPNQSVPFVAEVKFFDRQRQRSILADYLASYYHVSHRDGGEEEAGPVTQQSTEDTDANIDIQSEVLTAFVSLFGDHAECRTLEDAQNFLDGAQSSNDEKILHKVYMWCDNLITRATDGKKTVEKSASTARELSKLLENFTALAEDDNGHPGLSITPMVSSISFYFNNPLTLLDIMFYDTPGTSDSNKTRRLSARNALKECTHKVVLSDEARAKNDPGISKEVKKMKGWGSGRALVAMTKSDLMKDSTMPNGSKRDKDKSEQLRRGAERFKKELNAIEIQEADAYETGDDQRIAQLAKEKRQLEIRVKTVENAEKAHRIFMRSESNRKVLQEKLQNVTRARVQILSISNSEYARHAEGYKAKDAPVLSVEQTKIPEFRRLICVFPNEARLNELRQQQEENLPALLSRVRLYTERKPSERKADMEELVVRCTSRYEERMQGGFGALNDDIAECLGSIRAEQQDWRKVAGKLCDYWRQEYKTSPFLGLMKRDGLRKKRGKNSEVNLSVSLIQINSEDVDLHFYKLVPTLNNLEKDIIKELDGLVSDMLDDIRGNENEPFMALGPFYDYVYTEKASIPTRVKEFFGAVTHGIDEIRIKMCQDDDDAYLVEAMLPIYARVRLLKGGKGQTQKAPKGGWPNHRHVVFKEEVTKLDGLWPVVCTKVESDFKELMASQTAKLLQTVGAIFKRLHSGFNLMCEEKESEFPSEEKLVQEELKVNVEKAQQILDGPMKRAYDALQKDFREGAVPSE